jgi:rhodanese-related sulfurtransferase
MTFIKRFVIEGVVICILAGAVGLGANALHPNGVIITRNYFKIGGSKPLPVQTTASPAVVASTPPRVVAPPVAVPVESMIPAAPNEPSPSSVTPKPESVQEDCIKQDENGLILACFDFIFGAWSAMGAGDSTVVFVDARTKENYTAGHIPGAVLIDHYHQDHYLPDLLPRMQAAQVIVVYCDDACEASRYLTTSLIYEHQLSPQTLYIYEGGIAEWIVREQLLTQGDQP